MELRLPLAFAVAFAAVSLLLPAGPAAGRVLAPDDVSREPAPGPPEAPARDRRQIPFGSILWSIVNGFGNITRDIGSQFQEASPVYLGAANTAQDALVDGALGVTNLFEKLATAGLAAGTAAAGQGLGAVLTGTHTTGSVIRNILASLRPRSNSTS